MKTSIPSALQRMAPAGPQQTMEYCSDLTKKRENGKSFEKFDKNDLNCVHFYDDNIGYIVGFYGLILKYNNGKWEQMPNETKETLNSAYFVSAIYGWAVGKNGTILFYDGQKWVPEKKGINKN